jgi:hypothetical protein
MFFTPSTSVREVDKCEGRTDKALTTALIAGFLSASWPSSTVLIVGDVTCSQTLMSVTSHSLHLFEFSDIA